MKVALVHDWLTGMRGGERCLLAFLALYPNADIFTLVHIPGTTDPRIDERVRQVSFLGKIPGIARTYRHFLPLYPAAVKGLDLSGYDLVISLSHAAAKNVQVPSGVTHISYCFTPMRYVWDQVDHYFGRAKPVLWPVLSRIREWDRAGSAGVDEFVAISRFVAARIRCFYGEPSTVIYPPVETDWIGRSTAEPNEEHSAFLLAGALVPYKRPDLVVQACTDLNLPLWVTGSGPMRKRLERIAGPTVKFLGWIPDDLLAGYYRRCRALIFPGIEDFGMVPIECMAAGRPVIALGRGGLRDTIDGVFPENRTSLDVGGRTGVFFRGEGPELLPKLRDALRFFIAHESEFRAERCVEQAGLFSTSRFNDSWTKLVTEMGLPTPYGRKPYGEPSSGASVIPGREKAV